ncbi:protein Spindly [Drosophila grimshawi]|uniref:GH13193 n=1 Tax=Drosophila grimshawi TaxID=7222 RepID=B4JQG7_DROGR|nr:protein Spindly [Drosophila grimshawi]EDV99147.1 GH13193 [Drosophila grimshawi]
MYNNLDLSALSIDDIVEEYKILHDRHQQLKERSEDDAQRIHELKRSLDTALAAEKYLTQELEHLSAQAQAACPSADDRMLKELEEVRRKYKSLQLEQEILQQDYDAKVEETSTLRAKLESAARDLELNATLKANSSHDESASRLSVLELENAELMQKLAEYEDAKVQNTFALAEQEKTIEVLKDQVSCLEENMRSKRDDLEEKLQLLESAQEQLVDANAKIALLTSAPEHNDRKGNSLFAEVDDQRQVMKQLLVSQKKSYLDMKKIFNDSKYEIHRLKRENIAMHKELQACSTIFCSADKTYQNKLNERIRQLLQQNAKLERNLNVSQERLRELASQKSVTWLDSMLDFCKRETDELKSQLHSMHIQKATVEEQMRNVQQEMARWRFESLKSRCVLIDRENLLMEHKIAFKAIHAMEFDIKESQLQAALPRIVTPPTPAAANLTSVTTQAEIIVLDTPLRTPRVSVKLQTDVIVTPLKTKQGGNKPVLGLMKVKRELSEPKESHTTAQLEVCNIKSEEMLSEAMEQMAIAAKPIKKGTPVKQHFGKIKVKSEQQLLESPKTEPEEEPLALTQIKTEIAEDDVEVLTPAKSQRKGTPVKPKAEPIEIDAIVEAKPLRKGTPVRAKAGTEPIDMHAVRSILAKKRDLFADTQKNVQFSSNAPIVHNLSPDLCSPPPDSKENQQPVVQDVKAAAKKTQNIIRRIVVASKSQRAPEN